MTEITEKYTALIEKDIAKLQQKIAKVKGKYPEDYYGIKWMEKSQGYTDEINELISLKKTINGFNQMDRELKAANNKLVQCQTEMFNAANLLRNMGENKMADRLVWMANQTKGESE